MSGSPLLRLQRRPDTVLTLVTLALAVSGVVLSGSARVYQDAARSAAATGMFSSLAHLMLGLVLMAVTICIDYRRFRTPEAVWVLIGASGLLLIVTLFASPVANTHRWIRIAGISLQPSELAKPVLVIAVAAALVRAGDAIKTRDGLMRPLLVAALLCGLVVLGRDLGTPTVMFATAFLMTIVAGARWLHSAVICGSALSLFTLLAWIEPFRWKRLMDFRTAFDISPATIAGIPWQLQQSIVAIGSGGLSGKGLGMSTQKAFFLPEAEDDFVFAIVGEELGMIGALAILAAFLLILWRGRLAADRAQDDLGKLIAIGATWMLVLQAFVHSAVVIGLLPTKGLPLPFISAGGSSILASCILVGLILNVSLRGRQQA